MPDTRPDTPSGMAYWVAVLAPLLGDHALIIMSSLAGAMWPLSVRESSGRLDSAFFLFRLVCTASVLTGFTAHLIEEHFGYHSQEIISPVAFAIGAIGDRWRTIISDCFKYVREFLIRKGNSDVGNRSK
jgi:hypothetical protein